MRGFVCHVLQLFRSLARGWFLEARAIALQKPLISVRRKSLLQPAFLNLPRFDPFAGLALMMLKAIRLKAAKLAGA